MAQIFHGLSHEVRSTFITKFETIELFTRILDISAYTPVVLLLCCDNIKDWCIRSNIKCGAVIHDLAVKLIYLEFQIFETETKVDSLTSMQ